MKQEWQDISTAPQYQIVCLITSDYREFSGYKRGDDKWVTVNDEYYIVEDLVMWHPFPALPPKKMHKCDVGNFSCLTSTWGRIYIQHYGLSASNFDNVEVNYCPFCGLKAEKGREKE